MVERATAFNPRLLRWAREQSGLEATDVAEALGKTSEAVLAWEQGTAAPTWNQLERLASLFNRPIALFYFSEPPRERTAEAEFRRSAPVGEDALDPDTRLAVRDGRAWQQSLRELAGTNPSERSLLSTFTEERAQAINVDELAASVRQFLGVSLSEQFSWRGTEQAFKNWRTAVEAVGVFVFKRSFKQTDVSGFCLHDEQFPIVVINNSTAFARQTFTLFHEVAHLLFRVSGITHESFTGLLSASAPVEISCNRFAGMLLIPSEGFPWEEVKHGPLLGNSVIAIAERYSVSRLVVLRRLFEEGRIDAAAFRRWSDEWRARYVARREGDTPGGSYYSSQTSYLGDAYLTLAFDRLHSGRISLAELADHLNVRAKNIGRLEDAFLSRK